MAKEGEVRRGDPGQDRESLPQGAAQEINQETAAAGTQGDRKAADKEQSRRIEDITRPEGVELVEGNPDEATGRYTGDEDSFLFGGTTRPDESITSFRASGRPQPSRELDEMLPSLMDAADDPDAPPSLQRLVRLLDFHLRQA